MSQQTLPPDWASTRTSSTTAESQPQSSPLHNPKPAPKPISSWKLILLAFVRPFFVADRAQFLPYKILIPLNFIFLNLFVFVIYTLGVLGSNPERFSFDFSFFASAIHEFWVGMISGPYRTFGIPAFPLLVINSIYIILYLSISILFAPHASSPQQRLISAWSATLKRQALTLPAMMSVWTLTFILMLIFSHAYSQYYNDGGYEGSIAIWKKVQTAQEDIAKADMNGLNQSDPEAYKKLQQAHDDANAEYQSYWNQQQLRQKQLERDAPLLLWPPVWVLLQAVGIFAVYLLPIYILVRSMRSRHLRPLSPWPAFCEHCGYNLFPQNSIISASQAEQSCCAECGNAVMQSLPPDHRVGVPFEHKENAGLTAKFKQFIQTAFQPLFFPSAFAKQFQHYRVDAKHHSFARLMLWLWVGLIVGYITFYAVIEQFWLNPNDWQYNLQTNNYDEMARSFADSFVNIIRFDIVAVIFSAPIILIAMQLPAIIWTCLFRIFAGQRIAYLAHRVSIYLFGALFVTLLPAILLTMWMVFEINHHQFRLFFRHNIHIGSISIDEEIANLLLIAILAVPAFLYNLYLNYKVIKLTQYANR